MSSTIDTQRTVLLPNEPILKKVCFKFDVKNVSSALGLLSTDFLSKDGMSCLELYLSPSVGAVYYECAVGLIC